MEQEIALTAKELLLEFSKAFGASLDLRLWLSLIKEEKAELLEAEDEENKLKELIDLMYVLTGFANIAIGLSADLIPDDEMVEIEKEYTSAVNLVSEKIIAYDASVIGEAFIRVHESNMSKLGPDGKPIRREDGKILKGPNYKPADLKDLV